MLSAPTEIVSMAIFVKIVIETLFFLEIKSCTLAGNGERTKREAGGGRKYI